MNDHTANHTATFIAVAKETKVFEGKAAPSQDAPTVAQPHDELLAEYPSTLTSDARLFAVHARRQGSADTNREGERRHVFSKGQPCLRSSPQGKIYGRGTRHDAEGNVALYAVAVRSTSASATTPLCGTFGPCPRRGPSGSRRRSCRLARRLLSPHRRIVHVF